MKASTLRGEPQAWQVRTSTLKVRRRSSAQGSLCRGGREGCSRAGRSSSTRSCISEGELPRLSDAEVENLRRYLTFGGFVFADSNDGQEGGRFDQSVRRELASAIAVAPSGAGRFIRQASLPSSTYGGSTVELRPLLPVQRARF